MSQTWAVFMKDIRSEFRTRYAISSFALFVMTAVTMIAIASGGETMSPGLTSGILWVIMFFGSMTGLSKSFVSEEERGTSLLLKITVTAGSEYLGKLLFNIVLSLSLNSLAVLLFFIFAESVSIADSSLFVMNHLMSCLGFAAATTIISAVIARASAKGALFPALSFPVLLPLIIIGIETTEMALTGVNAGSAYDNLGMITAYCGVMITVSYFLFEIIRED